MAKHNFERAASMKAELLEQLEDGVSRTSKGRKRAAGDDESDSTSHHSRDRDGGSCSRSKAFLETAFSENSDESEFEHDHGQETDSSAGLFAAHPERLNWIVGPGSASSRLHTTHRWIDRGVDVSQLLATQRENAMHALEKLEDPDILVLRNFIYPPRIIQEALSIEQWTESVSQWNKRFQHKVSADEVADVVTLSLAFEPDTTYQEAVDVLLAPDTTKPMTRVVSNYLRTADFWSWTVEEQLSSKLMDGLFGNLPHITMHWTKDEIRCGHDYKNEEKPYPDFHISIKHQTIMLLEAKPPGGSAEDYREDRRKLFDEMKLAVDSLLRCGVDRPMVGFLVSGLRVETFAMTLEYEACYLLVNLGSFDLVGSRFQFGSLLSAARPLLTARAIVADTAKAMRGLKGEAIKTSWVRGSYHTKPIKIPQE
ncbi:hypothetical protein BGX28_007749 [Mortierella sp. GBA30]|nr:hypothetical protein BGX28_007749 [Mortierella sp. GBA30]